MIDFTIPADTIKWTYWIGVGQESEEAFRKDQQNFANTIGKVVGLVNPLTGEALGLFTMSHATVGSNVTYYFMPTFDDAQKFNANQPFMQFKNANIITDSGNMPYPSGMNQKCYIGFQNESLGRGNKWCFYDGGKRAEAYPCH